MYKLHGPPSEERNLVRDRRIRFSLRETDVGPGITFFTVYRDSFFPAAVSQEIDDARYAGNDTIAKKAFAILKPLFEAQKGCRKFFQSLKLIPLVRSKLSPSSPFFPLQRPH